MNERQQIKVTTDYFYTYYEQGDNDAVLTSGCIEEGASGLIIEVWDTGDCVVNFGGEIVVIEPQYIEAIA